jgi:acetyltransferase-like isoleucine patch superfamily enzyme
MDLATSFLDDLDRFARSLSRGPGSVRRTARLVAGFARGRVAVRRARRGGHVYVGGPLDVDARGDLFIGPEVLFFGGMIASHLVCHPGASVSIGAGTVINYGVSIEGRQSVRIGRRCSIGSAVRISDEGRDRTAPVVIGDEVWLAHGAIIEPGAVVGDRSVVSAGSVVTGAIPPGCLAMGNPARAVPLEVMAGAASY